MSTSTMELPGRQKPLSMWHNFSWIVLANAVHTLSRVGMVVVLTHMGGAKVVGHVVMTIAICVPIKELTNLGLRGVLSTDAKYEYRFGDYLGVRLVSVFLAFFITASVALLGPFEQTVVWLIVIVAFGKVFESISDIFHGLLQQHERMDRIGIALMIRGPGSLVLLAGLFYLTNNIYWAMTALPLMLAVTLLAYDLPNGLWVLRSGSDSKQTSRVTSTTLRPQWNMRIFARLAWLSLPLGIATTLVAMAQHLPRFLVGHQLGAHALGIFGSIAYLASAGAMIFSAMGQSSIPRLARLYAAGDRRAFFRLIGQLELIILCIGIGLITLVAVAGRPLLRIIYTPEYAEYQEVAVFLMVASTLMFLCAPLGRAIQAMRRFRTQMALRGLSIVVLAILLPRWIQYDGLRGATIAMCMSSLVLMAAFSLAILFGSKWPEEVAEDLPPSQDHKPKETIPKDRSVLFPELVTNENGPSDLA